MTYKNPPKHTMPSPSHTAVNSCQGTAQLCSNTQRPNHWKDPRSPTWHNSFLGSHGHMFEDQPPHTLLLRFGAVVLKEILSCSSATSMATRLVKAIVLLLADCTLHNRDRSLFKKAVLTMNLHEQSSRHTIPPPQQKSQLQPQQWSFTSQNFHQHRQGQSSCQPSIPPSQCL